MIDGKSKILNSEKIMKKNSVSFNMHSVNVIQAMACRMRWLSFQTVIYFN